MAWITLIVAGLFEIAWAVGLKYSHGFTKPWPSLFTLVTLALSMYLLALASRSLPIGTAYAVWVGIGAAGTAVMGVILLKEPASIGRACFLALLVIAIIGLKFTAPSPAVASGS